MPLTSDLKDSAKSATPPKAVAENAELEELAVLFQNHHKAIFRVAYRITGSRSDAEDVLQTIFLRLTPNRRDLSPNPEGYLHRAAVNASLDLIRSRTRANAVSLDVIDFDQNAKLST
ncbi:MAG TPA: sigma factor, partial [Pyrinomonadaceae bacterium]|nr:sigma factor [Pyrinomonadaceae bacterium]